MSKQLLLRRVLEYDIKELFDGLVTEDLLNDNEKERVWIDGCELPAFNKTRWNAMYPGLKKLNRT